MKLIKSIVSWIATLSVFVLIFWASINLFLSNLVPLKDAQIPPETIEFFKRIPDYIGLKFRFNPNPDPSNWGKYYDGDLLSVEDTCFIVYYVAADSAVERPKADLTLELAHAAIPHSFNVMQNYPYPYTQKGRKLPIYVANSDDAYKNIIMEIYGDDSGNSVAVYIFEYSSFGAMALGIVLSPEAWTAFSDDTTESYRITLWHEMNHYIYYAYFNFATVSIPPLWFTEGLAEYFAGNESRKKSVRKNKLNDYSLEKDFLNSDAYWVGYTAFLYLEENKGKANVSNLIKASYNQNLNSALRSSNDITRKDWDNGWKGYVRGRW
jgi:hypothetical protein